MKARQSKTEEREIDLMQCNAGHMSKWPAIGAKVQGGGASGGGGEGGGALTGGGGLW